LIQLLLSFDSILLFARQERDRRLPGRPSARRNWQGNVHHLGKNAAPPLARNPLEACSMAAGQGRP